MVNVIINPGSGPVDGASREHAIVNARAFAEELGPEWSVSDAIAEHEGRWSFLLYYRAKEPCPGAIDAECEVELDMPGLPLEAVRYTGADDENPFAFPRLYVDGNSWLWKFGISVARGAIEEDGEA